MTQEQYEHDLVVWQRQYAERVLAKSSRHMMTKDVCEPVVAQSDEQAWRKARWEGVTATLVGNLLGINPYEKRSYDQIVFDYASKVDTFEDNPSAAAGRYLEDGIIRWVSDKYTRKLLPWGDLCRSKAHPFLMATPDASYESDGKVCIAEIKTHSIFTKKNWAGGIPEMYQAQVQHQMLVTGLDEGIIVQWYYGEWPLIHPIKADAAIQALLVDESKKAWDKIVAIRGESNV